MLTIQAHTQLPLLPILLVSTAGFPIGKIVTPVTPEPPASEERAEENTPVKLTEENTLAIKGLLQPSLTSSSAGQSGSESRPEVRMGPGGFWVRSADGQSSIKVGGRVQTDINQHTGDGPLDPAATDGTELRRARIEMKGTLPEDLSWAAEVDFANNATSIKDFWVGYQKDDGPALTFGHQKQPYSLDIEMSSNDIPFVERGVDTFLVVPFVDRAIGLRYQDTTEKLFYAAGLFGEGVTPTAVDDEGWGLVGRLVYAPVIDDEQVVHLGVRAALRAPGGGADTIRIRDETTNMSNLRVVDTGNLTGVDSIEMYGAEAVWATGPFSVGGEYNLVTVDQPGGDLEFSSWHAQATYSLTGESRAPAYRLDAGEFKRLEAETAGKKPVELAARVASIDLTDGPISGGEQDALSLGINWYYSSNLRLMLNWTNILDTSGGTAATRDAEGLDVFTVRVQLNF